MGLKASGWACRFQFWEETLGNSVKMQGAEHGALETVSPGAHKVWELHNAADAGFLARKGEKASTWLKTDQVFFSFSCTLVLKAIEH